MGYGPKRRRRPNRQISRPRKRRRRRRSRNRRAGARPCASQRRSLRQVRRRLSRLQSSSPRLLRSRSSLKPAKAKARIGHAAAAGGHDASPAVETARCRAVEHDPVAKSLSAPDQIRGSSFSGCAPMKSRWIEADAIEIVARGAEIGIERNLALRISTTRLLGREPKLVLHGGGNTSLKTRARDMLGQEIEVLRIKASGADMAASEADGLPAVRLAPLRELRALEAITDEELLAIERANLI